MALQIERIERVAALLAIGALLCACRSRRTEVEPTIEFTKRPPAGHGTPDKLEAIEGGVSNAEPGQKIVLFARAGVWWVQPIAARPFTEIQDSKWKSRTHPGTAYAALLVKPGYTPPRTLKTLPEKGGTVVAVAFAEGAMLAHPPAKMLTFSGYDWELRQDTSEPGGSRNLYNPANAFVDKRGFLHLRIAREKNEWTSAEVMLTRSLGYGSYRFVVQDIFHLEPSAVLSVSIWDNSGPGREMDVEISRWGELNSKNAQYVIQPYYIPANVVRFLAPAGVLTQSLFWEPGRTTFSTVRGSDSGAGARTVAQHVFTSGIPSPGSEAIHINLYVFQNKSNPLKHESEVIIEKFEYLP